MKNKNADATDTDGMFHSADCPDAADTAYAHGPWLPLPVTECPTCPNARHV
ncbi:hypothetical protein [Bifidobacterium apri]|uniref:hypothetical protein n=1 Tax=Bifidobacterium apri TaxID=1769423 RepID=UPI00142F0491|nr:hypothetical protein [Bifidobacterium apri]